MTDGSLSMPTYRVIRCEYTSLEGEIRRRDRYDLEHVTQDADGTYTLFFRLKNEYRKNYQHERQTP